MRNKLAVTLLILILLPSLASAACESGYDTSIDQYGITWTFDDSYQCGTFANGDYWVIGPVDIVFIDPQSTAVSEYWSGSPYGPNLGTVSRIMHGSMINPDPGDGTVQGYDSLLRRFPNDYSPNYNPNMNVARPGGSDISASNPLTIQNGHSLVSTISNTIDELQALGPAEGKANLKTAAILTVLSSPPPEGSFRPPYSGSSKEIKYYVNGLDYSVLKRLTPVSSTPLRSSIEANFERPWIDHTTDWYATYEHPSENMPFYGRNIAEQIGDAVLILNLDFSNLQKETIYIRLVQLGIDLTGIFDAGGYWPPNGGIQQGRKLPILLTGYALNDPHMMDVGNWNLNIPLYGGVLHHPFQEDSQTFYVEETSPGVYNYGCGGYGPEHLGIAEWGRRHETSPCAYDSVSWSAGYRLINGRSLVGHALAVHIMEFEEDWNWDPFLDYMDRWWEYDYTSTGRGADSVFTRDMWNAYRDYTPQTCLEQNFICCPSGNTCTQPRSGSGCGDGQCCASEDDCNPLPDCGNGICASGECDTCPQDCAPAECCGDGTCNNGEDCGSCDLDCLDSGEECCSGTSYNLNTQVCCSGSVQIGDCCLNSDCNTGENCINYHCVASGISLANSQTMIDNSNNFAVTHPVENLWDGITSSSDSGTSGAGDISSFWVEFDFSEDYDLTQARLFGDDIGTWLSETWTLKYKRNSEDSWTTAFSDVNVLFTDWSEQSLDITARFVRIEVIGNQVAPATQARELEIHGSLHEGGQTYHRADSNPQDCVISIDELVVFMNRWKVSIADVGMIEMMEAIELWKGGNAC